MMQVIEQTDEEKLAMYMKLDKEELAKMLIECNKHIMRMGQTIIITNPPQPYVSPYVPTQPTWPNWAPIYTIS